ncbi:MAG TPA: DUF4403 family protein [Chitinophagaceae bacterium]|nr:DUF4403 family protein [Chitinophagaceae bacterium]
MNRVASILIVLLLLCFSSRAQQNPGAIAPLTALAPLQESVINIPVKINVKPYLLQAEAMTPTEFLSEGWPGYIQSSCDFRYKYRFLREGLGVSCINNKFIVTFSGAYQIAGGKTICTFGKQMSPWISGSCGFGSEPMRRVQISITSLLAFQPDYTLKTATLPEKITPVDKCTVTIFNSDVTQEVIDSIGASVAAFGNSIDQRVAGLNFSSTLQTLAERTGRKIALKDVGYLKLNPSSVKAGMVNLIKDTMYFTLGFSCYPEISSDSINNSFTGFLPPLGSAVLAPGFTINTNAVYDYAALDTLLNRSFRNKVLQLEGRTVNIKNIEVRGLDNSQVEVRIDFEGDKKGTVYFTGTPLLDIEKQLITIPDLDFSLHTKDIILNVGKALFNKKILGMLRRKGILSVSDLYRENKLRVDSLLNRVVTTGITTAGRTTDFKVTGLVVKKDNLLLQTSVSGEMEVLVSGYGAKQ